MSAVEVQKRRPIQPALFILHLQRSAPAIKRNVSIFNASVDAEWLCGYCGSDVSNSHRFPKIRLGVFPAPSQTIYDFPGRLIKFL